jgi:hypothetical protein
MEAPPGGAPLLEPDSPNNNRKLLSPIIKHLQITDIFRSIQSFLEGATLMRLLTCHSKLYFSNLYTIVKLKNIRLNEMHPDYARHPTLISMHLNSCENMNPFEARFQSLIKVSTDFKLLTWDNPPLTPVDIFRHLPKLEYFILHNGNFNGRFWMLDFSNGFPRLTTLVLGRNLILDVTKQIPPKLTRLSLSGNLDTYGKNKLDTLADQVQELTLEVYSRNSSASTYLPKILPRDLQYLYIPHHKDCMKYVQQLPANLTSLSISRAALQRTTNPLLDVSSQLINSEVPKNLTILDSWGGWENTHFIPQTLQHLRLCKSEVCNIPLQPNSLNAYLPNSLLSLELEFNKEIASQEQTFYNYWQDHPNLKYLRVTGFYKLKQVHGQRLPPKLITYQLINTSIDRQQNDSNNDISINMLPDTLEILELQPQESLYIKTIFPPKLAILITNSQIKFADNQVLLSSSPEIMVMNLQNITTLDNLPVFSILNDPFLREKQIWSKLQKIKIILHQQINPMLALMHMCQAADYNAGILNSEYYLAQFKKTKKLLTNERLLSNSPERMIVKIVKRFPTDEEWNQLHEETQNWKHKKSICHIGYLPVFLPPC